MIGKRYRSTGISLRYGGDRNPPWSGYLNFSTTAGEPTIRLQGRSARLGS